MTSSWADPEGRIKSQSCQASTFKWHFTGGLDDDLLRQKKKYVGGCLVSPELYCNLPRWEERADCFACLPGVL